MIMMTVYNMKNKGTINYYILHWDSSGEHEVKMGQTKSFISSVLQALLFTIAIFLSNINLSIRVLVKQGIF